MWPRMGEIQCRSRASSHRGAGSAEGTVAASPRVHSLRFRSGRNPQARTRTVRAFGFAHQCDARLFLAARYRPHCYCGDFHQMRGHRPASPTSPTWSVLPECANSHCASDLRTNAQVRCRRHGAHSGHPITGALHPHHDGSRARSDVIESDRRSRSLISHDLFRKVGPPFPDHAPPFPFAVVMAYFFHQSHISLKF